MDRSEQLRRYREVKAEYERGVARMALELDLLGAKIESDLPTPVSREDYMRWMLIHAEVLRLASEMAALLDEMAG